MDAACASLHAIIVSLLGGGVFYLRYLRNEIDELKNGRSR